VKTVLNAYNGTKVPWELSQFTEYRKTARKRFLPNLTKNMFATSLMDSISCNWKAIW